MTTCQKYYKLPDLEVQLHSYERETYLSIIVQ